MGGEKKTKKKRRAPDKAERRGRRGRRLLKSRVWRMIWNIPRNNVSWWRCFLFFMFV